MNILKKIKNKLYDAKCYLRNRYWDRIHIVNVKAAKPGQYYDADYIIFHAPFQVFKDFIETEFWVGMYHHVQLEMKDGTADKADFQLGQRMCYENKGKLNDFIKHALVLDAFDFHATSSPAHKECWETLKKVYLWYILDRPARKDPWEEEFEGKFERIDVDGNPTNEMFGLSDDRGFVTMNKSTDEFRSHLMDCSKKEEQYDLEDEAMMALLMKYRKALWT